MQNAFTFVIAALLDLYLIALLLRLALGMGRVDFRNPLAQAILKATNPLVLPLRRLVPAAGRLDTGSLAALLLVQLAGTALLSFIACIAPAGPGQLIALGLLRLAHLVLRTCFLLVLVHVIASWVSPGGYNPVLGMLAALVEPLLAPFRRIIPMLGPLDLSPLFALLAIEFFNRLLPDGFAAAGMLCIPF
ncbi:MAG: YggT family protein [Gammaproteobacteria bacterium]|nr:YggT family protein [Gammaproteobacteria bacterium]